MMLLYNWCITGTVLALVQHLRCQGPQTGGGQKTSLLYSTAFLLFCSQLLTISTGLATPAQTQMREKKSGAAFSTTLSISMNTMGTRFLPNASMAHLIEIGLNQVIGIINQRVTKNLLIWNNLVLQTIYTKLMLQDLQLTRS